MEGGRMIFIKKMVAVFVLVFTIFVFSPLAYAQKAGRVYRIGVLSNSGGIGGYQKLLQESLREFGYVEGRNLVIEWRFSKGDVTRHPVLSKNSIEPQILLEKELKFRLVFWTRRALYVGI